MNFVAHEGESNQVLRSGAWLQISRGANTAERTKKRKNFLSGQTEGRRKGSRRRKHLNDPSGVAKTVAGDVVGEDKGTILPYSILPLLYAHHGSG